MVVNTWLRASTRAGTLVRCRQIQNRSPTISPFAAARKPSPACPSSRHSRSPRFGLPTCFDVQRSTCARYPRRPPGATEPAGGRSARRSEVSLLRVPSIGSVRPPRSADRRHRRLSGHRRNEGRRSRRYGPVEWIEDSSFETPVRAHGASFDLARGRKLRGVGDVAEGRVDDTVRWGRARATIPLLRWL